MYGVAIATSTEGASHASGGVRVHIRADDSFTGETDRASELPELLLFTDIDRCQAIRALGHDSIPFDVNNKAPLRALVDYLRDARRVSSGRMAISSAAPYSLIAWRPLPTCLL